MTALPSGRHFFRGGHGYEEARRATVWNGRTPQRYPDAIVQAIDGDDVVATVRYAKAEGKQIGIRSGGHSWCGSHVRDGGVLLDVSRMDHCSIDPDRMVAVAGPGMGGSVLADALAEQGLFFPAGHCRGVRIGGYLLQGGYGWNSRVLGPACESVIGLDVVTADGERTYCDAEQHADLYWAARGSGPGFFAVVTAFHLRLYARPAVGGNSLYVYPIECADEVFSWARGIGAEVDPRVEFQMLTSRAAPAAGIDSPSIVVASPIFADTEDQALQLASILETCPVRDRATVAVPFVAADLPTLYDAVMTTYPDGYRYAADNMWTSASAQDLLPGVRRIIETIPPYPSHFLWLNWGPVPPRQDMAYSLEDDIYLAVYAVWKDAADDEKYSDWPRSAMAGMADMQTGIQLADENLGARPAKFVSDEAMAKLDRVRAGYDPDGRFYSWMGRP